MTTILIKKKDTAGAPAPGDLTNAAGGTEIAVNTATRRIYTKDSGGNVVELGNNATSSTIADLTVTNSTTLSYGTANQVQYLNGSKLLVGSANLTFDGTTLTPNALNITNAVTLTGGTANGVTYLNGSKVLTTGSVLVFDGTNLKLGTTGSTNKILVDTVVANGGNIQLPRGGFIGFSNAAENANSEYVFANGGNLEFGINGATALNLNSSGNLGLGVTPSAWGSGIKAFQLGTGASVVTAGGSGDIYIGQNTFFNGTNNIYLNTSAAGQYSIAAGVHAWRTAPSGTAGNAITFTQAMTLAANGQLRLGATVNNFSFLQEITGTSASAPLEGLSIYNTSASQGARIALLDGTNSAAVGNLGGNLLFYANGFGTERARIDSSGNLGLGVTPGPWSSGKAIEVGFLGNSIWGNGANSLFTSANAYFNSGWKYAGTGAATASQQSGGLHYWFTAPSGTAGNAITFTQAMTLDASGRLMVGPTSSTSRLSISGAASDTWAGASSEGLALNGGVDLISTISTFLDTTSIRIGAGTTQKTGLLITGQSTGSGSTIQFSTGGSQAMTLDANGNLSLGVTSTQGGRLSVVAAVAQPYAIFDAPSAGYAYAGLKSNGSFYGYFGQASGIISGGSNTDFALRSENNLLFAIGAAERARIDSSGNLLVGTTSNALSSKIYVDGGTGEGVGIKTDSINSNRPLVLWNAASSGQRMAAFLTGTGAATAGFIESSGTTTVFGTSSDYRLKNVTGALTGYKERLMSLQPKQGTWIADGAEFRGFLAHEFAVPYRASVSGEKDAVDANGKPLIQGMQASTSEVMADLIALVQEQQALIENLTTRLAALEAK